jgi:hypothetical protein
MQSLAYSPLLCLVAVVVMVMFSSSHNTSSCRPVCRPPSQGKLGDGLSWLLGRGAGAGPFRGNKRQFAVLYEASVAMPNHRMPCRCLCSGRGGLLDEGGGGGGAAASTVPGNGCHQHLQAAADDQPHTQRGHGGRSSSGSSSSGGWAAACGGAGSGRRSRRCEPVCIIHAAAHGGSCDCAAHRAQRWRWQRRVGLAIAGRPCQCSRCEGTTALL